MAVRRWLLPLSGWIVAAVLLGVWLTGRNPAPPGPFTPSETAVDLIDANYPPALQDDAENTTDTALGWNYRQSVAADLDGDGQDETVLVMARVELVSEKPRELAWNDGQPWQVYVRDGDKRTLVYSRWVQLGQLNALISQNPQGGPQQLALLELTGSGVSVYRIAYEGPGTPNGYESFQMPVLKHAGPALLPSP